MPNYSRSTICALWCLLLLSPLVAAAHNGQLVLAYPVDSLVADGDFSDWPAHIPTYSIALPELGIRPDDESDFQAGFRAAYSPAENALYIAVQVDDQSIVVDPVTLTNWGDQWDKQDGCELYLTLDHADSNAAVLQFSLWGDARVGHDSGGNGLLWNSVEVATRRAAHRHFYEWRVDIGTLSAGHIALAPRQIIGFDLVIADKDADGTFSWMAWGRGHGKYAFGERHGDLVLATMGEPPGHLRGQVRWQGMEKGTSHARILLQLEGDTEDNLSIETDQSGRFGAVLPAGAYTAHLVRPARGRADSTLVHIESDQTTNLAFSAPLPLGETEPAGQGHKTRVGNGFHQALWHVFDVQDGLPSSIAMDLLQDHRGYFWIGTHDGLVRYDGDSFTTFAAQDGLGSPWINRLLEDRRGNLWIGTRAGLVRYDGARFTRFSARDGLPDQPVTALLEDRRGNLWIGFEWGGASRYDGEVFTHFTTREGLPGNWIQCLLEDRAGNLWFGSSRGGIARYDGGIFSYMDKRDGLGCDAVNSMLEDRAGNLWFGTGQDVSRGRGIVRYDGEAFLRLSTEHGLPDSVALDLLEDDAGALWIATRDGLSRYDGRTFANYTAEEGLPHNWTNALAKDHQGNLWVGTIGGIARYHGTIFSNFTTANGLPHDHVTALCTDGEGHLWIGTRAGLSHYDGHTFTTYTTRDGLPNDWIMALAQDDKNNLWIGMAEGGIARYDGQRFAVFNTTHGLVDNYVRDLYLDSRGNLWIGTAKGASRYDGHAFTNFTARHGLVNDAVYAIGEDVHGDIWLGTMGGASRYNGQGVVGNAPGTGQSARARMDSSDSELFAHFTSANGLPHDWISAMTRDRRGPLWFATYGGGISRYDGQTFNNLTSAEGLAQNGTTAIVQDRRGHLWIGTGGGVSRYDGLVFQNLTRRDGLAGSLVTALLEDQSGDMWIATASGLTRYHPGNLSPPVHLLDVIGDQRYGPVASISLASTQSYLSFEFQGTSFGMAPEHLAYAYKLAGYDADWRWTRDKKVEYSDLSRGRYTFQVRAVDRDLNYSEPAAAVAVDIHLPYERIAWIVVTITGILLFFWQTARIVRRDHRLQAANYALQEANQQLRETRDQLVQAEKMTTLGLLAGGIAHEINNPLQTLLAGSRRILRFPGNTSRHLESAHLMEQAAQRCSTIVQNLLNFTRRSSAEMERVDLGEVVESTLSLVAHLLAQENIEVRIDKGVAPIVKGNFNELCTVLTNLVINARDAVSTLDGLRKPRIEISASSSAQGALLQVRDNGPGIATELCERIFDPFFTTKEVGQGTGLGLSIVRGIAERHGGHIELESTEGQGTTFRVRLPAE